MTTFGDMVYQFGGMPVGGMRYTNPWTTHWFVDYDNGNDSNPGKTPGLAFSTIQQAEDYSSAGDVIYIRPRAYQLGQGFRRYGEDVVVAQSGTGSGTVEANAGRSFIGVTPRFFAATDFLGVRWKYATNTNLNIESPGTHIENIGFFCEDATYGIYLECDGGTRSKGGTDGSSIYNCALKGDGGIYMDGGNEVAIVNCRFQAKYDGTVCAITMTGSTNAIGRVIIKGCEFIGGNANNADSHYIGLAAPAYDLVVRDCYFSTEPDSGQYISFAGTTSDGIVANCYFASDDISDQLNGVDEGGGSGIFGSALCDQTGVRDISS